MSVSRSNSLLMTTSALLGLGLLLMIIGTPLKWGKGSLVTFPSRVPSSNPHNPQGPTRPTPRRDISCDGFDRSPPLHEEGFAWAYWHTETVTFSLWDSRDRGSSGNSKINIARAFNVIAMLSIGFASLLIVVTLSRSHNKEGWVSARFKIFIGVLASSGVLSSLLCIAMFIWLTKADDIKCVEETAFEVGFTIFSVSIPFSLIGSVLSFKSLNSSKSVDEPVTV